MKIVLVADFATNIEKRCEIFFFECVTLGV